MTAQQDDRRMLDEIEQMRTALESALEENARLTDDRDRLLARLTALSQELQMLHAQEVRKDTAAPAPITPAMDDHEQEEKLRIAFEELQVLTEELEAANSTLQDANQQLDAKVEERTQQINEINIALRISEASRRTITDLVPDLLWRANARGEANWFNQRWCDYTGREERELFGSTWLDYVHPLDRPGVQTAWREALDRGAPFESEHRIRDAAGEYRWFLARAVPMSADDGRILEWYATGTDIHDQRAALEALQQSELRFRRLVEGMPQLVWRAIDAGKWTWSSPQWEEFTGQSGSESHAMGWLEMIHPADRPGIMESWSSAEQAGLFESEARVFHDRERRYRHFRTRALPLRGADGGNLEWLGTSTDIDDIIQLREQQSVLVRELQHRTRNLMAVIHAMMKRTLRDSSSLEVFRERFESRLRALARVQGLLSRRERGMRVSFDRLLHEELSAHVPLGDGAGADHVILEGPLGVALKSGAVQTFALALHELATNAVKYGALSQEEGRLHVTWDVKDLPGRPRQLCVDWRETGVSDLQPPAQAKVIGGYGRELIEKALPHQLGARTTYAFEPGGVHCTIEVDVPYEGSPMEGTHV